MLQGARRYEPIITYSIDRSVRRLVKYVESCYHGKKQQEHSQVVRQTNRTL